MVKQVIAVDWSGAKRNPGRKIWIAVVRDGLLHCLEGGRNREETAEELVHLVRSEPASVIGLDFAFSFPGWFVGEKGCRTAREFWDTAAALGEDWISPICAPFYTCGRWKDQAAGHYDCFRRTDCEVIGHPESVFRLVGPKQVGRGSVRGMPHLRTLQDSGCHIWPFDAVGLPLVVEIFPRALYGLNVRKSSKTERKIYFRREFPGKLGKLLSKAVQSDDAFDAAASALVMDRHKETFLSLPKGRKPYSVEGRIWVPNIGERSPRHADPA